MLMTWGGGGGVYNDVLCTLHTGGGGGGGGGSGGMPPRKFLNFRPSEITSGAFSSINCVVLLCRVAFAN